MPSDRMPKGNRPVQTKVPPAIAPRKGREDPFRRRWIQNNPVINVPSTPAKKKEVKKGPGDGSLSSQASKKRASLPNEKKAPQQKAPQQKTPQKQTPKQKQKERGKERENLAVTMPKDLNINWQETLPLALDENNDFPTPIDMAMSGATTAREYTAYRNEKDFLDSGDTDAYRMEIEKMGRRVAALEGSDSELLDDAKAALGRSFQGLLLAAAEFRGSKTLGDPEKRKILNPPLEHEREAGNIVSSVLLGGVVAGGLGGIGPSLAGAAIAGMYELGQRIRPRYEKWEKKEPTILEDVGALDPTDEETVIAKVLAYEGLDAGAINIVAMGFGGALKVVGKGVGSVGGKALEKAKKKLRKILKWEDKAPAHDKAIRESIAKEDKRYWDKLRSDPSTRKMLEAADDKNAVDQIGRELEEAEAVMKSLGDEVGGAVEAQAQRPQLANVKLSDETVKGLSAAERKAVAQARATDALDEYRDAANRLSWALSALKGGAAVGARQVTEIRKAIWEMNESLWARRGGAPGGTVGRMGDKLEAVKKRSVAENLLAPTEAESELLTLFDITRRLEDGLHRAVKEGAPQSVLEGFEKARNEFRHLVRKASSRAGRSLREYQLFNKNIDSYVTAHGQINELVSLSKTRKLSKNEAKLLAKLMKSKEDIVAVSTGLKKAGTDGDVMAMLNSSVARIFYDNALSQGALVSAASSGVFDASLKLMSLYISNPRMALDATVKLPYSIIGAGGWAINPKNIWKNMRKMTYRSTGKDRFGEPFEEKASNAVEATFNFLTGSSMAMMRHTDEMLTKLTDDIAGGRAMSMWVKELKKQGLTPDQVAAQLKKIKAGDFKDNNALVKIYKKQKAQVHAEIQMRAPVENIKDSDGFVTVLGKTMYNMAKPLKDIPGLNVTVPFTRMIANMSSRVSENTVLHLIDRGLLRRESIKRMMTLRLPKSTLEKLGDKDQVADMVAGTMAGMGLALAGLPDPTENPNVGGLDSNARFLGWSPKINLFGEDVALSRLGVPGQVAVTYSKMYQMLHRAMVQGDEGKVSQITRDMADMSLHLVMDAPVLNAVSNMFAFAKGTGGAGHWENLQKSLIPGSGLAKRFASAFDLVRPSGGLEVFLSEKAAEYGAVQRNIFGQAYDAKNGYLSDLVDSQDGPMEQAFASTLTFMNPQLLMPKDKRNTEMINFLTAMGAFKGAKSDYYVRKANGEFVSYSKQLLLRGGDAPPEFFEIMSNTFPKIPRMHSFGTNGLHRLSYESHNDLKAFVSLNPKAAQRVLSRWRLHYNRLDTTGANSWLLNQQKNLLNNYDRFLRAMKFGEGISEYSTKDVPYSQRMNLSNFIPRDILKSEKADIQEYMHYVMKVPWDSRRMPHGLRAALKSSRNMYLDYFASLPERPVELDEQFARDMARKDVMLNLYKKVAIRMAKIYAVVAPGMAEEVIRASQVQGERDAGR